MKNNYNKGKKFKYKIFNYKIIIKKYLNKSQLVQIIQ